MKSGRARLLLVVGGTAAALVASTLVLPGCGKPKAKPAGEAPVPTQEKTAGGGTAGAAPKAGPPGAPRASANPKGNVQSTGGAKMGSPGGAKGGQ
jgi:hypothetical protein